MADLDLRVAFPATIFDKAGFKVMYSGIPDSPVIGDKRYVVATGAIERYNGATWDFVGTGVEFITVTPSGDDKGLNIAAELSVGSPSDPHETVLGEGDSYPVDIAFHVDYANISGLIVTSATDVTTILQSDSGSTTGLFDGTVAGKTLLIGSDYPFGGVKVKIDTLGDIEPDNVIGEYLKDNGPTWIPSPYMVTDANFPYDQKGASIASCSSCSEQWRFGFDRDDLPTTWSKVTLTIDGVTYEKYWGLFRVVTAITADAILEQMKQHTNRWECNADGNTEYFGRARYPRTLVQSLSDWTNTPTSPSNDPIDYSNDITLVLIDNQFNNGAVDAIGVAFKIPIGLDTSIPLYLDIFWFASDSGVGDLEWIIHHTLAKVGDKLDGTASDAEASQVVAISNQEQILTKSTFKISISKAVPGDTFALKLERDATTGNANDTYSSNIIIESALIDGYFWRP